MKKKNIKKTKNSAPQNKKRYLDFLSRLQVIRVRNYFSGSLWYGARKKMKLRKLTHAVSLVFSAERNPPKQKLAFISLSHARSVQRRRIKSKRLSTPEDFFFGFLVAVSLVFSFLCFRSVATIPISSPLVAQPKGPNALEKNIKKMTKGYPIAQMSPYIAGKNKRVAAFLVAIAKKESNWGVYSPKKRGKNCFNYWGYRGQENPTLSGYSCFSSPRQAVNVVGRRLKNLVAQKIDTPREMVLWKCGDACTRSGARGEAKWVRDVGFYYEKMYN